MFNRHTAIRICKRFLHVTPKACDKREHPLSRTLRILKEDFIRLKGPTEHELEKHRSLMGLFPRHCDIVIIGGGAVGSSIAYWLKERTSREGISVVVVEKDPTYVNCTTALSAGALHQQYSLPENIQMSAFGAEFIRTVKKRFGSGPDINFHPYGYLVLADEEGAQTLMDNCALEKEYGVKHRVLSKNQLKEKFPWMNVDDVEIGSIGLEKQGWFDPWALLTCLRTGAEELGAQYIKAEVVDFMFEDREDVVAEGIDGTYQALKEVVLKMPDGEHKTIQFAYCIIAGGTESIELAQLARIGEGSGMLSINLPIKKRKRYVYSFDCLESPPGINTPMTSDYSGLYFRRNNLAGTFIAGLSPFDHVDTPPDDYFNEQIVPLLQNRVPAFSNIKKRKSWCGTYEYNYYDDTGIMGPHPYYHNLYLATGFSGYGIQQAPAVGRGMAEMILDGYFRTIDLTRFGFDRLIVDKPMFEYGFR